MASRENYGIREDVPAESAEFKSSDKNEGEAAIAASPRSIENPILTYAGGGMLRTQF